MYCLLFVNIRVAVPFLSDFCFAPLTVRLLPGVFIVSLSARPFVKLLFVVLHESVELVQVDVSKDWADAGALGYAAESGVIFPVLHIPCIEEFPNQLNKGFIFNPPAQDIYKAVVVYRIKVRLYISLHKPFHTRKVLL